MNTEDEVEEKEEDDEEGEEYLKKKKKYTGTGNTVLHVDALSIDENLALRLPFQFILKTWSDTVHVG